VSQFAYAVRVDVGGEEAIGWRVGGEGFDVVMIAVRSGTIVMTFTYLAAEGRTDRLSDPLTTTRTGVQKLVGRRETPVMLDRSPA
jgi:hypothetical protein